MDNWQLLLTLLNSGEYVSGEELGVRLGVSRAAVWKQIKRLRADLSIVGLLVLAFIVSPSHYSLFN